MTEPIEIYNVTPDPKEARLTFRDPSINENYFQNCVGFPIIEMWNKRNLHYQNDQYAAMAMLFGPDSGGKTWAISISISGQYYENPEICAKIVTQMAKDLYEKGVDFIVLTENEEKISNPFSEYYKMNRCSQLQYVTKMQDYLILERRGN